MFNIKKARKFDGLTAIMTKDEFDVYLYNIDELLRKTKELEEVQKDYSKLRKVLVDFAYFDPITPAVYVQISLNDLCSLTELVAIVLPKTPKSSFDEIVKSPGTKIWENRENL